MSSYLLATIRCVACGKIQHQCRLGAGDDIRVRCKGCGQWSRIVVLGANGEPGVEGVSVSLTPQSGTTTMADQGRD